MHGQKNLDIRILSDRFEWIGYDRHLIVKNDKFEWVENDRHEKITRHHHEEIGGDRNLLVKGKEALETTGSRSLKVVDDVIEEFAKNHSTKVTEQRYLKADHIALEADTNITLYVGESWIAINADGIKIKTTGKIELEAGEDVQVKCLQGQIFLKAQTDFIAKSASAGILMECPSGDFEMMGTNVEVTGQVKISLGAGTVAIN